MAGAIAGSDGNQSMWAVRTARTGTSSGFITSYSITRSDECSCQWQESESDIPNRSSCITMKLHSVCGKGTLHKSQHREGT
jgi:hypothetical protein